MADLIPTIFDDDDVQIEADDSDIDEEVRSSFMFIYRTVVSHLLNVRWATRVLQPPVWSPIE